VRPIRFALIASVALFSAPALAADLGTPAAGLPLNWAGLYVGAQIGYGWGSTTHTFSNGAPNGTSNPSGVLGGVLTGYNWQVNNFVVGVVGDLEAAGLSGGYANNTGATSVGSANMNWDGSLRARLGTTFGQSLVYLTGGAAFAGYTFGGGPFPPPPCCSYSSTLTGWTIGAGWEYAFNQHFTTRIEYRYSDYGSANGPLNPTFPGVNMPTTSTTSEVRVGAAYKF
jgi:outer membrane immunogenic protein